MFCHKTNHALVLVAVFGLFKAHNTFAQGSVNQRPIIMIVVDDLFQYEQYRNRFGVTLQTPNLDRLASRGVVFSNAFAAIPVCNGSRTAALTGLSQFRTGRKHPNIAQTDHVRLRVVAYV